MDYRVTDEALTQSANSIRSKSGSSAPIPWDNLTGFKSAIDSISTGGDGTSDVAIKSSDAAGVDLDIADTNGNVLVRFANGHIQTKEFNSENLTKEIVLGSYHTDSASGAVAAFDDGADNIPVKDLTINIKPVQSGSDDPSPTNVRAIGGWTGVVIKRFGKNLLEPFSGSNSYTRGTTVDVQSNGTMRAHGTVTTAGSTWLAPIKTVSIKSCGFAVGDTLMISCGPNAALAVRFIDSGGTQIRQSVSATYESPVTDTIPAGTVSFTYVYQFSTAKVTLGDVVDITTWFQIERGSHFTGFAAYQSDAYEVAFPSSAGTVYGGTLDAINGVLTVNFGLLSHTFGELTEASGTVPSGYTLKNLRLSENFPADTWLNDMMCNIATPSSTSNAENVVRFSNDKTYCIFTLPSNLDSSTPVVVAYPLASSRTYSVDPALISTLLGKNTIYADTGDVTVTYRADPTLAAFVQDVQINGNSILNNGIANMPIASSSSPGVVKVGSGLQVGSSNELETNPASLNNTKAGTDAVKPLVPSVQHAAAFYGLAKAAGDTSQSQSANSVGTYTDDAKAAIQRMLGLYNRGELIANVTTTEDATEIVVNTDLSGQAFRLTKLIAIFSAGPSTTGATDSFYGQFVGFDENNTQKTMSFPSLQYVTGTSDMFAKITLRVEPGMPITCEAIISIHEGNTQYVKGMPKPFIIDYITSFRIYQSASNKSLIPAGSNLKVYGVRA